VLASIAALAEFPERIKNIIKTYTVNGCKVYGVTLSLNGSFKEIYVDNYFPYNTSLEALEYAKAVDIREDSEEEYNIIELWVPILEKAIAKAAGSYEVISGSAAEALFSVFTGYQACCVQMGNMSTDEVFDKLLSYDKKDYLMSTSSHRSDGDHLQTLGLYNKHAYTILGAHKYRTRYGEIVRLVELRNPHGLGGSEWKGKWSDECPNWTRDLKRQCNWTDHDMDGRFFMSAEDFQEYFTNYRICKYGKRGEKMPKCCPSCEGTGKRCFVVPCLNCQFQTLNVSYWHPTSPTGY